ncbi:MAG: thioesterase family protein [Candidatus Omnitrophota bacterium]|nr:acyl-CoA thioesterase [Candidatus Omnitrophota bacterium]
MQKRIYYHDTDCGGVVYYANYLKFLEEARTEFMEDRGILMKNLIDRGEFFVVARQEVDYKAPAHYADTLTVDTIVSESSAVKVIFSHEIRNQHGRICVVAKTTLVYVDKNLKPKIMPEHVRKGLISK